MGATGPAGDGTDTVVRFLTEHGLEVYGQRVIDSGIRNLGELVNVDEAHLTDVCFMPQGAVDKFKAAARVYKMMGKKERGLRKKKKEEKEKGETTGSSMFSVGRMLLGSRNDALDEQVKKSKGALTALKLKTKLKDKLLKKPPFRFLHDVILDVIETTGFGRGLFDDRPDLLDGKSLKEDHDTKVIFFRRALRFLDEYTGDIFGLGSEALVKGQSVILTNQWLESFAEAAAGTDPATSAAAVKATLAALEAEDAIHAEQALDVALAGDAVPPADALMRRVAAAAGAEEAGGAAGGGGGGGDPLNADQLIMQPAPPDGPQPSKTAASPRPKPSSVSIASPVEQRLADLRRKQLESALAFQEQDGARAAAERAAREAADRLETEATAAAGLEMRAWQLAQELEEAEHAVEEERRMRSEAAAVRVAEAERLRAEREVATAAALKRREMAAIEAAARTKEEARKAALLAATTQSHAIADGGADGPVDKDAWVTVKTAEGNYLLRPFYADTDNTDSVAVLCSDAYEDASNALAFPPDFSNYTAKKIIGKLLKNPGVTCIVAIEPNSEGKDMCGACVVDLRDEYASLWPVAVRAKHANIGIGRALLKSALRVAHDARKEVACLRHLSGDLKCASLGASLGFRCYDVTLSLTGFVEIDRATDECEVRMMDGRDVSACSDLYHEAFPGTGLRMDAIGRTDSPLGKWVAYSLTTKKLVGFSTGFHMQGFTLTKNDAVFKEMLSQCTQQVKQICGEPLEFNLPISGGMYGDLLDWCLTTAKMKVEKQHNTMVKEWMPGSFSGIPPSARPSPSQMQGELGAANWGFVYCPSAAF